ncbi:MAG: YlbL family protein [Gaiellaceae bacterium]
MVRRLSLIAAVIGTLGLVVAFVLWRLPADEFILAPDRAKPLAGKVEVENARPAGDTSVYYVDVFVRRTSLLEQLLPFTQPDGSTVLPEHALLPAGTSEEERDRQNEADMERSELIAAVVALRALGYEVDARPTGILVTSVAPDAPAAGRLEQGDVVVRVDGSPVRTPDQLRAAIGRRTPGDDVRLTVLRDGKRVELTVTTVPNPSDPDRPIVGIQVDQEADIDLPFAVDIDLGPVGGPSAGLPFALEVARKLGRDVTNGCRVAATGALALDGTVIPVGAVEQKTYGTRRSDVDVFLVPAGQNAATASEHADDVRIVPVESFQQALRQLATNPPKC